MQATRIVIADDHAIVRTGLRDLVSAIAAADRETGPVDVVAEAEQGIEAIAAVKNHQPDLLLLDIAMPYAGGLEIIDEVRQWSPDTRIVVFTGVATGGVMSQLIQAKVSGILLKSCSAKEIEDGLAAALKGEECICEAARELAQGAGTLESLTSRERQVLHQIVAGASNAEIAERFNISPKTVDNHRTNLMRKLDVHSVTGLIQVAMREGLVGTADQSPG
jgi:DNA-binding NarL/FixJ family response regulator